MQVKNIILTSDHAGAVLKNRLAEKLSSDYKVTVLGAQDENDKQDYPKMAKQAALLVKQPETVGIFICGSGIGMSIQANRYSFIRAALVYTVEAAKLARQHNDANVLCLGARLTDVATAWACVQAFLSTEFEGGRHVARVEQLKEPV